MKRLRQVGGSGVHVMVIGHTVSLDYQGPVLPSTMGSANGLFLFSSMSKLWKVVVSVLGDRKDRRCWFDCIENDRLNGRVYSNEEMSDREGKRTMGESAGMMMNDE